MGHKELIESLGGGTAVATELACRTGGLSRKKLKKLRDAAYKWRHNGVPWRWRNIVAAIAEEKGVALPRGFAGVEKRENGSP